MAATAGTTPFAPFEWMLASRYLRARRKEGFISIIAGFSFLGIMLGVATLIIVMAVMNGFREELFQKILGVNGHVIANKIGGPFEDYDAVAKRIAAVPGVTEAVPLLEGQVLMSTPAGALGVFVRGLREHDVKNIPLIGKNVRFGSFDGFDGRPVIAVGIRLANALGVGVGDTITVVSPRGKTTILGTKPNIKPYKVAAIFEVGMSQYDKTIAIMPLDQAQLFFNRRKSVTVIEVLVRDPNQVEQFDAAIRKAVGPTIHITDWRQRNEGFLTVLEVERNVMFIILSLIVLVAAFNIIAGLMMLVKDKGRDIAILRTMGASRGAMMRVFLITGASIGIAGTVAGLILGLVFCEHIEVIRQAVSYLTGTKLFDPKTYFLNTLPVAIDVGEVTTVVLMAFALSVLATLYPSWRASRLDPVEALRYE